jgi:glutamate synthase domain-containing protein 3
MVSLEKILPDAEQRMAMNPSLFHQGKTDEALLRHLLQEHHRWTGSLRAREILDHWEQTRAKFVKVFPLEYQRALGELTRTFKKPEKISWEKSQDSSNSSVLKKATRLSSSA